jgi:hypothetical protein
MLTGIRLIHTFARSAEFDVRFSRSKPQGFLDDWIGKIAGVERYST